MGWSESEIKCMKHPNQKQETGICSCCLNEKLSKVSLAPTIFSSPNYHHHHFSSPSNNISSPTNLHCYSSGSSSPSNSRPLGNHHRAGSDIVRSTLVSSRGLKKSNSIVVTLRGGSVKDGVNNGKKNKEGFWSKLIKSTSVRRTKESYVHPRIIVR